MAVGAQQRLYRLEPDGEDPAEWWPISSAKAGFGNREGSGQTPTGLHRICACIGDGAAPGARFVGREPTGEIIPDDTDETGDFITSRILWLDGLETGFNRGGNVDSRRRYIYIHGTPHVAELGRPRSAGCLRMNNKDICDLFTKSPEGTLVLIYPDS